MDSDSAFSERVCSRCLNSGILLSHVIVILVAGIYQKKGRVTETHRC